jgi:hypothetical protein
MRIPLHIQKLIDEVYRKKAEIKNDQMHVDNNVVALKDWMSQHDLDTIETGECCARLSTRTGGEIDAEVYYDALDDWDKFISTVVIRKETKDDRKGANAYFGKEMLDSMTKPMSTPVLRITRLTNVSEVAPVQKQEKAKVNYA